MIVDSQNGEWVMKLGPITRTNQTGTRKQAKDGVIQQLLEDTKALMEKEGLWWLCEYAAEKHGITAVASKGEPGLLATEYLYDALVAAKVRSLDIGAISDYDPWGAKIPVNLLDKFQEKIFFGPKPGKVKLTAFNAKEKDLEKFFTPEEIERYKRDLRTYSQYKHSQVKEWVDGGGGIKREWYGIHIDTANRQRLRDEVDRWVMSVS